tara:strand:- start:11 stop:265 length:255 start_codon:yes stop_codon:yes gene_type:complete
MAERTEQEIEEIYNNADHNVQIVITNAYNEPFTDINKATIQENVAKLEEIKAYKKEDNTTSIWTDDYNFEKIDAAIIFGKTFYE